MSSSKKENQDFSFFVLPNESPESSTIEAYIGKYSHCILYNNKGRKTFVISSQYATYYTIHITVFSRLNAPGVYLKFGSFDLAFF